MSRESCIAHPPKQAIAIVRQDYYELMERDACAAALLNIFEYWANAALASDPTVERPWVGARPVREFERLLLGIATDKQIRKRLLLLEVRGFIQTRAPGKRGEAKSYRVMVPEVQQAVVGQMTEGVVQLGSNSLCSLGQITAGGSEHRSNNRTTTGQTTEVSSVKRPILRRSFDPALKKISKESRKEDLKEESLSLSSKESGSADSRLKPSKEHKPVQVGCVRYAQPPESIDLSELWLDSPEKAMRELRAIAPGHKRLEMVAHGCSQWWIGPGLNDFDEHLIQACRNRKRKFQQPDSVSDAKTFINNMIRNGDWANFSLRCEEAVLLQERTAALSAASINEVPKFRVCNPFECSPAEKRESALGLARFKVSQGNVERAIAISQQFGLGADEIGLIDIKPSPTLMLSAA